MSCIPSTPVVSNILTGPANQGWTEVGVSLITTELAQYKPILAAVVPYYDVFTTTNQHCIIRQLEFEETAASSGDVKKVPLIVAIYGGSQPPSSPVTNTVYNPTTTGLLTILRIAEADYKRTSDTVWTAVINPDRYIRSGTTASTDAYVNMVFLSDKTTAVTYASGASGRVRMFTEQGTAL